MGAYHYYVVMPHFYDGANLTVCKRVLAKIPSNQLLLLDRKFPGLERAMCVYQDFENDIFEALVSAGSALDKYDSIVLIFPEQSNHPTEIIEGVKHYCERGRKCFEVTSDAFGIVLERRKLYLFLKEDDLAIFIKKVRQSSFLLGRDIGTLSFNETVFKELLDISVISTDFAQMGRTAAKLILGKQNLCIRNEFRFIPRGSL